MFCWVMCEAERTLSNFYIQLSLKFFGKEREVVQPSPTMDSYSCKNHSEAIPVALIALTLRLWDGGRKARICDQINISWLYSKKS